MSESYGEWAAEGAELRTQNPDFATRRYREACHLAASSTDSYGQIRAELLEHLRPKLTEGGAKGIATKVATVAIWLRRGNQWPGDKGLTPVYNIASATGKVVCPNCSHMFTP